MLGLKAADRQVSLFRSALFLQPRKRLAIPDAALCHRTDILDEESEITLVVACGEFPMELGDSLCHFLIGDAKGDAAVDDIDLDLIAFLHDAERAAERCFRRNTDWRKRRLVTA